MKDEVNCLQAEGNGNPYKLPVNPSSAQTLLTNVTFLTSLSDPTELYTILSNPNVTEALAASLLGELRVVNH